MGWNRFVARKCNCQGVECKNVVRKTISMLWLEKLESIDEELQLYCWDGLHVFANNGFDGVLNDMR